MTLPTSLLQRRASTRETDIVVVGAGLSGLVCACVLARAGRRVVVIDRARRAGGRLKTVQYQGYAVDLGPVVWEAPDLAVALAAAGVADTALAGIDVRRQLRLACARPDGSLGKALPIPVPGAVPSPSTLDAVRELYGIPPRIFAAMGDHYATLAALDDVALAAHAGEGLADWLRAREVEQPVAKAFLRSAELLGAQHPETASIASLARRVRVIGDDETHRLVSFGDGPIAGAQGVTGSLVDSLIEAGGELRLGTRAVGLALDEDRCVGVAVSREEQPFLEAIEAAAVVLAVPRAEIGPLLPESARAALAEVDGQPASRALGVGWGIGGEVGGAAEDAPVVLDSVPAVGNAEGAAVARLSIFRASAVAPRVAPPGRTLVLGRATIPAGSAADAATIDAASDQLRAALEVMLPGAGKALEWEQNWLLEEDGADPLVPGTLAATLPGLAGVRLANAEVRLPGVPPTGPAAAARAGLVAAERILAG